MEPFAIVATKSSIIKRAKSRGLFVIQRFFLIDTEVYDNLLVNVDHFQADIIEIMPSRVTDFFREIVKSIADLNHHGWVTHDA